jgi:hypothetical protein
MAAMRKPKLLPQVARWFSIVSPDEWFADFLRLAIPGLGSFLSDALPEGGLVNRPHLGRKPYEGISMGGARSEPCHFLNRKANFPKYDQARASSQSRFVAGRRLDLQSTA